MTLPATAPDLRRLAEAARQTPDGDGTGRARASAYMALHAALRPDRVLALLDRLAALEEALRRLADDVEGMNGPVLAAITTMTKLRSYAEARAALAGTPKP